jgi:hypothetical protein
LKRAKAVCRSADASGSVGCTAGARATPQQLLPCSARWVSCVHNNDTRSPKTRGEPADASGARPGMGLSATDATSAPEESKHGWPASPANQSASSRLGRWTRALGNASAHRHITARRTNASAGSSAVDKIVASLIIRSEVRRRLLECDAAPLSRLQQCAARGPSKSRGAN